MTNVNSQNRAPNTFHRIDDTHYIGSYFAMTAEFHDIELVYDRQSRNGNEVWNVMVPSPRSGVLFPIGTATYMHGEAEGEGPYFLGKIEDPSGIIPFKIAPQDPTDESSVWVIRYNPPMTGGNGQGQMSQPRTPRRNFASQRPTTLGPGTGFGRPFGGSGRSDLNGASDAEHSA